MGGWSPGREHRRVETVALSAEKRLAQLEAVGVERSRALGTERWVVSITGEGRVPR